MVEAQDIKVNKAHTLNIDSKITVTGVLNVEEYDDKHIVLKLANKLIIIDGSGFNIEKLDIKEGNVVVNGVVDLIKYTNSRDKVPLLKRILK
jgi:sporulation protein YabP